MPEPRVQRSRGVTLAVVWALLFGSFGCQSERHGATPAPRANVVWIVLDAAGASHFGLYGYARPTTPSIDRLGGESAVFERAYAQYPSTVSSTGSFLTGRYPHEALTGNKVTAPTIATYLRAEGFRTAAFSENPWVAPTFGFAQGFDEFQSMSAPEGSVTDRRDSAATINRSIEWIEVNADAPFMLYVHIFPPHAPYDPPSPFEGNFRAPELRPQWPMLEVALGQRRVGAADLQLLSKLSTGEADLRTLAVTESDIELAKASYDENLAYADHQVGRLLEAMRELDLLERSVIIVTADHGEAFGEHAQIFHGSSLYAEQIHVPLVIRLPKSAGTLPGRWPTVVELVDIVPTLLDLQGIRVPDLDGQSLLPLIESRGEPPDEIARSWLYARDLAAVQLRDAKLITDGSRAQRFDLREDPLETNNLAGANAPSLEHLLVSITSGDGEPLTEHAVDIDESTKAELEALGYVVGDP